MKNDTGNDIARLTDYATGETPPQEFVATQEWIASREDREAVAKRFEQVRAAMQAPALDPISEAATTDRVTRAVFSRMQGVPAKSIEKRPDAPSHPAPPSASTNAPVIFRSHFKQLLGVGTIACLCALVFIIGRQFTGTTPTSEVTTQEFIARSGEQITVDLIDGSRVKLAPGSRMQYSTRFGQKDRAIHLSGRAFFEVAHNAKLPFVVYAEHSAIQVLGTSFVVSAYPTDTSVQVVVRDGKVALRTSTAQNATGVALTAGDLGTLSRSGLVTVAHQVNVAQHTAWTERRLVFEKTPLPVIVRELELRYGIDIIVDPSLESALMTASFDKESADAALERVALGLRAQIVRSTNQYRITP